MLEEINCSHIQIHPEQVKRVSGGAVVEVSLESDGALRNILSEAPRLKDSKDHLTADWLYGRRAIFYPWGRIVDQWRRIKGGGACVLCMPVECVRLRGSPFATFPRSLQVPSQTWPPN